MAPSRVRIPPSPLAQRPPRVCAHPRRGCRAVECGGLENRYPSLGGPRVQIPRPPLLRPEPVWLSGIPAYSAASSRPAESARIRLAGPRTVARLSHALRRPRLRGRASCSTLLALLVGRACKVRVDERDRLVFVAG